MTLPPSLVSTVSHGGNRCLIVIVVVTGIYGIFWSGPEGSASSLANNFISSHSEFDEEKCTTAVKGALNNNALSSRLLSSELTENIALFASSSSSTAVLGDYVDVDGSSASSCVEKGLASLGFAIAQRAAMNEKFCSSATTTYHKRAIWLAFKEEGCTEKVKQMFEGQGFSILDPHDPLANNIDTPIYLLVGPFKETLPNSQVENIAMLRIMSGDIFYQDILQILFSLYRRVRINGHVVQNGCSYSCKKGFNEFFTDGNHTMLSVSPTIHSVKKDNNIRIPPAYRKSDIAKSIDLKVTEAWGALKTWHRETVNRFFGHVGNNAYQTFRYIEAMRHVVNQQKLRGGDSKEVTVNVCETGFNGGHSAMLFLSFIDKEKGVNVNYWGWDLKQVGSASPIAEKMKEKFGANFHIVWGDSKETLKQAQDDMKGQLCHVIVVDGEHSKEGVVNDLENFLRVAHPGAVVFGDDCAPYKRTVPKSEEMLEGWMEFVKRKQIISVANYRNPTRICRGCGS